MILSYFRTNLIFLGEGGAYLSVARYMIPRWGEAPSLAGKYKTVWRWVTVINILDYHGTELITVRNILLPCSQFEGYRDTQHKDTRHEDIQYKDAHY